MNKITNLVLVSSLICISLLSVHVKVNARATIMFNYSDKLFIESFQNVENISLKSKNIEVVYSEEGIIQVVESSNDGQSLIIYSPASETDILSYCSYMDYKHDDTSNIWLTVKTIWAVLKFVDKTKDGSRLIEKYGDYDFYGDVWNQIKDSIIPQANYQLTRKLYKNPNCQPQPSYQCNSSPNVYWKSLLDRVF